MKDFAQQERRRFIENVSAFHRQEMTFWVLVRYGFAWTASLIFNTRMPHERA
jgi:hypothetical protein